MTCLATDQGGGETDQEGSSWASLPELLLWAIKDKLDIFDNCRFPAVCRDWRYASTRYPKTLQHVPWIWQTSDGSREIISVTREHKLTLDDMPELDRGTVLFSKEGWLFLMKRGRHSLHYQESDCVLLVNPLTRVTIKLPGLLRYSNYSGYFITQDGYPHRIFIIYGGGPTVISETRPGDQKWTNNVFFGDDPRFSDFLSFVVIGDVGYCKDCHDRNLAFNLVDNSWKVLPKTKSFRGYFVDLDCKLVLVELSDRGEGTITFYRYNHGDSSWQAMNNNEVMDTSWFLDEKYCIVARGTGVKAYSITEKVTYKAPRGIRRRPKGSVTQIDVHDLVTGSSETLHLPFELNRRSKWVALG